jgi:ribosomal protein S1
MPSPDPAPPSDGTGVIEPQVSPAAGSDAGVVTGNDPVGAQDAPGAQDARAPEQAEGEAKEALAAPAPGEAPKRKRRRRRRKRGGQAGALGGAAAGTAPGTAPGTATGPGTEGATERSSPEVGAEASETAGAPDKGKDKKRKNKKQGDKPREKREPRERPVFGVGDVVFGKILEITDEALFVDLSGKAKGIFDRAEMLLPDDPPDAPPPPVPERDDRDEAKPTDKEPAAEASEGERDTPVTPESPVTNEAAPPAEAPSQESTGEEAAQPDVDVPPTVTSGGIDRRPSGRRIIVAAGVKALDAVPPAEASPSPPLEAAPEADATTGETGVAETLENAPTDPAILAVPTAHAPDPPASRTDGGDAPDEPAPQRPAPYAPPIVLEIGAHFVALVHNDGARGGLIVLTRHPRRASQAKGMVQAALREKKTIKGLVTGVVKGGAEVDVDGLRAFAPGSHMERRPGTDLHKYIGQRLDFEVTQYGKRGRDVVLSRKAQIEAEAKATRGAALAKLSVGSVVEGTVKSVVTFGAFIDVGGVEGLVALPEMSHNRSDNPSDVFKVGETTKVKILRIDDKGKVWLSRKAAVEDPRLAAIKKYSVGSRHTGKVVRLQPFGAFVELEPGIDGLIHILDLSMKRIEHPSEVVKVDDSVEVVVASVEASSQKIALHPAPAGAAADEPAQRVQIHKPLKVVVVAIDPGGLIVRVLGATGRQARGFITAAATGTPRGTELRKPFPVGTQLEAKVVEYDPKRGDLKLSIKALREDTERSAYQQYRQQVNREAKFGTFGDLLAKKGLPTK